mgnify:CR=1 FL=1
MAVPDKPITAHRQLAREGALSIDVAISSVTIVAGLAGVEHAVAARLERAGRRAAVAGDARAAEGAASGAMTAMTVALVTPAAASSSSALARPTAGKNG